MFSENYRATQTLARASFGYLRNTYPDLIGKYCPPGLDIHSQENGSIIQAMFFDLYHGPLQQFYLKLGRVILRARKKGEERIYSSIFHGRKERVIL